MFVLSVYYNDFYKELRLPVINDSDYSIVLNKGQFKLKRDIELVFEAINNQWIFKGSTDYKIFRDSDSLSNVELTNNDVLQIYTVDRENLTLIARDVPHTPAVYDKYNISAVDEINIGKNQDMDICYDYLGLVSREHATISRRSSGWTIYNKSPNGIYVNSKHIIDETIIKFGDHISIMGLDIVFLGEILAIDNSQQNVQINHKILLPYNQPSVDVSSDRELLVGDNRVQMNRAPRNIIKIDKTPIDIEPVPAKGEAKEQSLFQTIISSLAMSLPMLLCGVMMIYSSKKAGGGGGFMYTGIIMSLSSALIGIVMTLINRSTQKKQQVKDELHRFDSYSKYLIDVTEKIRQKYNHNMNAMHIMYKSAEECTLYDVESGLLWNRNNRHDDFMFYRLGLGDIPFQAQIGVSKTGFSLAAEDTLLNKPEMIKDNFSTLYNVPVGVDLLKHKMLGLVGGKDCLGAVKIVKLLATQIAANNCYTDIKMVFVYNSNSAHNINQWDFIKWFPHVWSEDKKVRFVASNQQEAGDVFFELARVFRERDEIEGTKEGDIPKPYYIMFLMNPEMLEGELVAKYVYGNQEKYGLTTVFVTDSYANLPNACEYVVENDDIFEGKYSVSQEDEEIQLAINFDDVSDEALDTFARRLANYFIRETETGGDIPATLSFFDMYGVNRLSELNVIDRWRKNRVYDNIRGFLGQKAGGNLSYLDVHEKYHGPHGLVAGTTGSGKSETLQTYMLSLAVNYSPDDVGFFVIDYKGGGMANLFNGLPHLIGQISNLSGNQVRRAMVSIKSENRRRQTIFNESGVNNINLYTKLYKNNEATIPVPHLFIIIDEFAELKREEPDFMRELISVAQVGRSLGVHLILATQKPSGTVDDNIWSNTKFRLCLRVAEKQDSMDMLHKPDAAYISQAGRCYLQVGNDEIFELFQSGYSGATYQEEDEINTEVAKIVGLTGKVDMTGNYSKMAHKDRSMYKWAKIIEGIVANSMINLGVTIEQCVSSKLRMDNVIEEAYVGFENAGIDYPVSNYNSDRLQDYINTYYAAMLKGGDVIRNLLDIAAEEKVKLPQEKEKTQLDAVKEYLAKIAEENGYNHELQLWMPVLPTHLYLDKIDGGTEDFYANGQWTTPASEWSLDVVVGLVDDPQNQSQVPLRLSFSEGGHHAVCGMVTTGRSTSLQTIVYALINKYTPSYVNIYGVDFSSKMMAAFEKAPHVGDIVYEGEYEKIAKLFKMLGGILEERKRILKGGNYKQYVQVNGVTLPAIVLFIDNFGAFNEKTEEKYFQDVLTLAKEGISNGIYMVLSSTGFGGGEIPGKIAENIKTCITTEMTDKFSYADVLHTFDIEVLPETGVKGRGLAVYGKQVLEYQTALGIEAQDDYERLGKIANLCEEMGQVWTGRKARPIPVIPEKPIWSEFSQLEDFENAISNKRLLPVGYNGEDASIFSVDLSKIYCYLATGFARSGKKNFLRVAIQSALRKNADVCIIDGPAKLMESYRDEENVTYIEDAEQLFKYYSEMIPEFQRRNQIKRDLLAQDLDEEEIYEVMSREKPIFMFVSDFEWYMSEVYEGKKIMNGFLENIVEKGKLHNIYFFGMIGIDKLNEVDYRKAFKLFVADKIGIHFGGNAGANRIFNFDSISYKEQAKIYKAGIGLAPTELGDRVDKVIVPLARR